MFQYMSYNITMTVVRMAQSVDTKRKSFHSGVQVHEPEADTLKWSGRHTVTGYQLDAGVKSLIPKSQHSYQEPMMTKVTLLSIF